MHYLSNNMVIVIALASLSLLACEKKSNQQTTDPAPAAEVRSPTTSTGHAPKGAQPGSHEDWCGEHQVPESLCTRCNSSLIPAFKATGDWCEEHGLPESQCLVCNPDLKIERPPRSNETNR